MLDVAIKSGFVPDPAMVVGSGGGVHIYWPISPVMDISDPIMRNRFTSILRRICVALGGVKFDQYGKLKQTELVGPFADPSCCEIARIFRIPGTFNHKPTRQRVVQLLRINDTYRPLPLAWWGANMPIEPAPPERRFRDREDCQLYAGTLEKIQHPAPMGQRHQERKQIAASAAKSGCDAEAIQVLLDTHAANGGSPRHVYQTNKHMARWTYNNVR
jgi:hypothetical protein